MAQGGEREADGQQEAEEEPGWFASLGIVMALLMAVRFGMGYLDDPEHKKWLLIGTAVTMVSVPFLRRMLINALLLIVVVATLVYAFRHREEIRDGRVEAGDAVQEIARFVIGFGPIDQFRKLTGMARYGPYLDAVNDRDPAVTSIAAEVTRGCEGYDDVCVAKRVVAHVTSTMEYRRDPVSAGTEGDYVRPPRQTLEERAGDCDDLTVVTISLASAVGVPGYMAFEPGHVYPILCPESGDALPNAIMIDGRRCYAAEVTVTGSKLAVEKDLSKLDAVFDPVGNAEVRVRR
jgi:hypothetical protein